MAKKQNPPKDSQSESPRILVSKYPSVFRPECSNPLQKEIRFDKKVTVELYTPSQPVPFRAIKWFESEPSLGVTWSDQIEKIVVSTHVFTDLSREKIRQRRFEVDIKENPARVIHYFLNCFQTSTGGRAFVSWERPPYEYVLNYVAEKFLAYIHGKGSLDEAFGLRATSKGRGAASPKEQMKRQDLASLAAFIFNGLLQKENSNKSKRGETSRDRALDQTAKLLTCSRRKVESCCPSTRSPRPNTLSQENLPHVKRTMCGASAFNAD